MEQSIIDGCRVKISHILEVQTFVYVTGRGRNFPNQTMQIPMKTERLGKHFRRKAI